MEIKGLNGIEEAGPGELTFVSNPKYGQAARIIADSGAQDINSSFMRLTEAAAEFESLSP